MRTPNPHLVQYIEDCKAKLKSFPNLAEAKLFVAKFKTDNDGNPDAWIEAIFEGSVLIVYEGLEYDGSLTA